MDRKNFKYFLSIRTIKISWMKIQALGPYIRFSKIVVINFSQYCKKKDLGLGTTYQYHIYIFRWIISKIWELPSKGQTCTVKWFIWYFVPIFMDYPGIVNLHFLAKISLKIRFYVSRVYYCKYSFTTKIGLKKDSNMIRVKTIFFV